MLPQTFVFKIKRTVQKINFLLVLFYRQSHNRVWKMLEQPFQHFPLRCLYHIICHHSQSFPEKYFQIKVINTNPMVSGVTIDTLVPESLERMTDTDCRLLYLVTDFSIRPLLIGWSN